MNMGCGNLMKIIWFGCAYTASHTHTTLTLQHTLHVCPQCTHFWVSSHISEHFTHCHQGLVGALLPQAILEDLILLGFIMLLADLPFITICNDVLVFKFQYNGIGIHIFNKPGSEVVKNLFRCAQGEDLLHTNLPTSNTHRKATL